MICNLNSVSPSLVLFTLDSTPADAIVVFALDVLNPVRPCLYVFVTVRSAFFASASQFSVLRKVSLEHVLLELSPSTSGVFLQMVFVAHGSLNPYTLLQFAIGQLT